MAGSIRSVIAENGLEVSDVSQFWHSQGMRIDQQVKRVRGQFRDGRFCSVFALSEREAVDKFLNLKRDFELYAKIKGK